MKIALDVTKLTEQEQQIIAEQHKNLDELCAIAKELNSEIFDYQVLLKRDLDENFINYFMNRKMVKNSFFSNCVYEIFAEKYVNEKTEEFIVEGGNVKAIAMLARNEKTSEKMLNKLAEEKKYWIDISYNHSTPQEILNRIFTETYEKFEEGILQRGEISAEVRKIFLGLASNSNCRGEILHKLVYWEPAEKLGIYKRLWLDRDYPELIERLEKLNLKKDCEKSEFTSLIIGVQRRVSGNPSASEKTLWSIWEETCDETTMINLINNPASVYLLARTAVQFMGKKYDEMFCFNIEMKNIYSNVVRKIDNYAKEKGYKTE